MTLEQIEAVLTEHNVKYKRKRDYIKVVKPKLSIIVDELVRPNTFPVYIVRDNRGLIFVMSTILETL